MGDLSKSPSQPTTKFSNQKSSIKHICNSYKHLLHKWHRHRHRNFHISSPTLLVRTTSSVVPLPTPNISSTASTPIDNDDDIPLSFDDCEELHISSPTLVARTTSRIAVEPNPTSIPSLKVSSPEPNTPKVAVRPVTRTPILFSQSGPRRKAAPVEKKLECSLEELCFGCVKKINVTRNALTTDGLLIQEEEVLTMRVKPGWRKGTRIMFEGKGDAKPGMLPADIIFEIREKMHPLYERKGDDLELGAEVPLVEALTGCTMSVPLLGGREMDLTIEDVIYPGYEMIILEQGMPRPEEGGRRGDLRLQFTVEFPSKLTEEQKLQVASVLEGCP